MSLADLKSQLPDYAKDLRLNLESVLTEGGYRMLGNWLATTGLAGAVERSRDLSPLVRLG